MGVLRQKCVISYESFLNGSNLTTGVMNTSYDYYLQEIDNESRYTRIVDSWHLVVLVVLVIEFVFVL